MPDKPTALERVANDMAVDLLSDQEFVAEARELLRVAFAKARRQLDRPEVDTQK